MKTLWFGALVGLVLASGVRAQEKKPVPLYTNEDLDRVSPYRGQTGVFSKPAVDVSDVPAPEAPRPNAKDREAYWRREAARVRERIRSLEDRADEVRRDLQERRSASSVWSSRARRGSSPSLASREARLQSLERRIRDLQLELEDRARRAGALPGWLR